MIAEEVKTIKLDKVSNLYDAKSLAEALGVSTRLIHYFRNTGKLKYNKISPSRFVFYKEDVIAFLNSKGYTNG
jgi:predicted site-specific integrase-resolvase